MGDQSTDHFKLTAKEVVANAGRDLLAEGQSPAAFLIEIAFFDTSYFLGLVEFRPIGQPVARISYIVLRHAAAIASHENGLLTSLANQGSRTLLLSQEVFDAQPHLSPQASVVGPELDPPQAPLDRGLDAGHQATHTTTRGRWKSCERPTRECLVREPGASHSHRLG